MAGLTVTQRVAADPERVFAAMTDWPSHERWMVLTRAEGGRREGAQVRAFTGIGPVGFLDTMVIREWDPPRRCVVRHVGRLVRGSGAFEVEAAPGGSLVRWSEWLELPLGRLGRAGWPLVRPVFAALVQLSLRRLARWVETGAPGRPASR